MVRRKLHPQKAWLLPAIFGSLLVASCDATKHESAPDRVQINSSDVLISAPLRVRSISAIDPAALRAVVTLNNQETELQVNASGQFGGQFDVPAGSRVQFTVEFFEWYAGQKLMLANSSQAIVVGSQDSSIRLNRSDYTYNTFDDDRDGVSNILERENSTSPLDAAQFPDLVTVEVIASPPLSASAAGYESYQLEATVGSTSVAAPAQAGRFSHIFNVAREEPLNVELRLIESQTDQRLTIGAQSKQLTNLQNYTVVSFDADSYNLAYDEDGDGTRDLDELIAGTDLFSGNSSNGQIAFTVTFPVPSEIANPDSTYATLLVDGRNIDLVRNNGIYSGTAIVGEGASVFVEASINDTYDNSLVVLATSENQLSPSSGESFELYDFYLEHDADEDGVLNYEEIAQGSDPYDSYAGQCAGGTYVAELTQDAFVNGSVLFNIDELRVDSLNRVILMRFAHDVGLGEVTSAELTMTVGADQGEGEIVVHALPDFDWDDQSVQFNLPPLNSQVGSLDEDWDSGDEYVFDIDPSAITGDFTLFLQQLDGNDVAFESIDTSSPPILSVTVEGCD